MNTVTIQNKKPILVSLDSAADSLSVSVWTIRAWAQKGLIPTVKIGRRRMIRSEEVIRIAERGLS